MSSLPAAVPQARVVSASAAAPTREGALGDSEGEYRRLMRKWWFGAAVAAPTMVLSYPWLFPRLEDRFPRGLTDIRILWAVLGAASLAVLAYSGSQFSTGARRALRGRQANMYTLIAVGTGVAWVYSTIAVAYPGLLLRRRFAS